MEPREMGGLTPKRSLRRQKRGSKEKEEGEKTSKPEGVKRRERVND